MSQFPARISVTELDGTNGFALPGEMYFQYTGASVASADINGDGFDDLIIGAPGDGATGIRGGTTYVVFGTASGFGATLPLSTLNGTNGFKIVGGTRGYSLGFSVASAGDVNGDGIDDIIIGAVGSGAYYEGEAYVIFGKETGFSADFDLATLDGTNGFKLDGATPGIQAGWSVGSAGDMNGDGFDDVVVTSWYINEPYTGVAYVVFGGADTAPALNLSNLNGENGFQIAGPYIGFAHCASTAGDINGDGFDDLIIGQLGGDSTYIVYGKSSGFAAGITTTSLNGTNGFEITGTWDFDRTGYTVGAGGDINGDGLDDFFVGAPDTLSDGTNIETGATYVVFGTTNGFPASWSVASLNGANGFKIREESGYSSWDVWSAGDVNGDGFDDLAVASLFTHTTNFGDRLSNSVSIIFGQASGFPASVDLSSLDGSNGFTIDVGHFPFGAFPEVSSGDINGDGFSDLIIGETRDGVDTGTANSSYHGTTYVVFGRKPDAPVIRTGTAAAQCLAGGDFADLLSGLAGGDHLYGNGGDDRLIGGGGADTLTGGAGQDTFVFASTSDFSGDSITDFDPASDFIDLISIQGLSFIGTAGFSNVAGQMNYVHQGNLTLLQIDDDGNGTPDAVLQLNGTLALSASNFDVGNGPSLSATSPLDNATSVAVGANIVLTFDRAVLAGTGNIEIRRSSDGFVVRSIAITDASQVFFSSNTVTINPTADLRPGTAYYVTIGPDAIHDNGGRSFTGIWSSTALNFTTAGAADTTAPTLVNRTPADNAPNVAVGSNIVLTFDETVQPGSGNIEIYHANNGYYGGYLFAGISASDASQMTFAGNTVTINPSANLLAGHSYYVLINPGVIQDAAGNDFSGISSSTAYNFTVAGTPDTTPPTVNVVPGNLATNVSVNANFIFTADETVQAGVAPFEIRLASDHSLVARISSFDTSQVTFAGNTVTVNPAVTLAPGTSYTFSYADAIVDTAGNGANGLNFVLSLGNFTFTTAGVGDSAPPTLVNKSIANNATDVPVDTTLVLTFSEPVKVPYQGSIAFVNLDDPFSGVWVGLSDPDYVTISGRVVTITLPHHLEPDAHYEVRFSQSLFSSFADVAGNQFNGAAANFQFTTASTGDPPGYVVDYTALLSGFSWDEGEAQQPTIITYSFETSALPHSFTLPDFTPAVLASFEPFSAAEKDLARDALAQWADVSGIIFLEASAGLGDIQFAKYDFSLFGNQSLQESAAFAYLPVIYSDASLANSWQYFHDLYGPNGHPFYYGNIFVDTGVTNSTGLLLHEIGHALGLKHPFDGSPVLDPALDSTLNTVMSYTGVLPATLQFMDVAAVQYLYGPQSSDGTHLASWSWNANTLTQVGTSGADTIRGVYSANIISGDDGNDLIVGGPNNDSLDGGSAADRLFGDSGNDALIGGDGSDVMAGGLGNDNLMGGDGDDFQYGEAGADVLAGGAGADLLSGGEGTDTIDGGGGLDTAVFSRPLSDYSINKGPGQVVVSALVGLDGTDTLTKVERLVFSDETIILVNIIMGTLGSDSLYGTAGDDEIDGLTGNDWLQGGAGDDHLIGGPGLDVASYADAVSAVIVDLSIGGVQNTGGAGSDELSEIEYLIGSTYGDSLKGNGISNVLLFGGAGNDVIHSGAGSDYLVGGSGFDAVSYAGASAAVSIDLSIAGVQNTGGAGSDQLNEIEYVIGSVFGDSLKGDGVHNVLLSGGGGNDLLYSGAGSDYLIGGAGFDVVSYANAAAAVVVDLSISGIQNTLGAGSDQLNEIEYVIGSAHGDSLKGNGVSNVLLWGGAGNDVIHSGAGSDYLVGGAGFDAVSFAGASAGVNVDLSIAGVQNTGGAGSDQLNEIEYVIGSAFNDVLKGDGVNNVLLSGMNGNDTLQGGAGADYLLGGSGIDTLTGLAGADTLVGGDNADRFVFSGLSDFSPGPVFDTITDFSALQNDKIDFSIIDASTASAGNQAFAFLGTAAFGGVSGQLRYSANGTGGVNVEGDIDGDAIADFTLTLESTLSLTATDFVL